jgi:hypothetical protein
MTKGVGGVQGGLSGGDLRAQVRLAFKVVVGNDESGEAGDRINERLRKQKNGNYAIRVECAGQGGGSVVVHPDRVVDVKIDEESCDAGMPNLVRSVRNFI